MVSQYAITHPVNQVKSEIMLCTTCHGEGYVRIETLVDHHKGDYEVELKDCPLCKGSGRLKKTVSTTTTYEIVP